MKSSLFTLFALALFSCSSSTTQEGATTHSITQSDFLGKSFKVAMEAKNKLDAKELEKEEWQAVFGSDTAGVFRVKTGSSMQQRTFGWQLKNDSLILRLKNSSVAYAVSKDATGYLLTSERDQMLFTPVQ